MLSTAPSSLFRNELSCLKVSGIILVAYYVVMDIIMLMTFAKTDFVVSSKGADKNELFSPFTHMSVKALMNDHTGQYVITPAAEYFDAFTRFSTIFYFISPNMISFFHLFLASICCRLISSESLQTRRYGVLLFEFRSFLDSLDGVVYRSHSNTKGIYQSVRSSLGYYVDIYCDLLGGCFLMFGVLFYLFKRFNSAQLPWRNGEDGAAAVRDGPSSPLVYSKKMLFWKCLCYGLAIALAGKFWDNVVDDLKDVFQTPIEDPTRAAQQFDACHSLFNIIVMWVWRLVEGQAMLQYVLLAIFLDKIWEFINYVQYSALAFIVALYIFSCLYAAHLRAKLQL